MNHVLHLESGKTVTLRPMKIEDYEIAAEAAAAGDPKSSFVFSMKMQKELLKILLVAIDGQHLKGVEKEQIAKLLRHDEYLALGEYVGTLMGKSKVLKVEFQKTSGAK